jgi:hypothetical protein
MAGFVPSIPALFTAAAWLIWFALPLLVRQARRLQRRDRRGPEAGRTPRWIRRMADVSSDRAADY